MTNSSSLPSSLPSRICGYKRGRKVEEDDDSIEDNSDTKLSSTSCFREKPHRRYHHPRLRRRSSRGNSSLSELAKDICVHRKRVVIITGAGVSVASGVKPFRGSSGVWTQVIWTTATRKAFRKDPLKWYNDFWLPFLELPDQPKPNAGHLALAELLENNPNIRMITQNVDGLHVQSDRLIEAHGRLGLYKCLPAEDSDTDSDSDDDDERAVHLGHRRKQKRQRQSKTRCRYQLSESLRVSQLEPSSTRSALRSSSSQHLSSYSNTRSSTMTTSSPSNIAASISSTSRKNADETGQRSASLLSNAPKCPSCGNSVAPQALLFDEGYHAHDFYQFRRMEEWIEQAEVIVFVGTSFAVTLTEVALDHAREFSLPVYNFNTQDFLESTIRLNVENVTGPSEQTLPQLLQECQELDYYPGGRTKQQSPVEANSSRRSRRKIGRRSATPADTPRSSIGVECSS